MALGLGGCITPTDLYKPVLPLVAQNSEGKRTWKGKDRFLLSVVFSVATQLSTYFQGPASPPDAGLCFGCLSGSVLQPEHLAGHLTVQAQPLLPAVTRPLADPWR